jgi:hypothetical protein
VELLLGLIPVFSSVATAWSLTDVAIGIGLAVELRNDLGVGFRFRTHHSPAKQDPFQEVELGVI